MTHTQVYKRHASPHSGLLLNGRERERQIQRGARAEEREGHSAEKKERHQLVKEEVKLVYTGDRSVTT